MGETSENPKCHLHIPQFKKGNHLLNIIVQSILKKWMWKKVTPRECPKP